MLPIKVNRNSIYYIAYQVITSVISGIALVFLILILADVAFTYVINGVLRITDIQSRALIVIFITCIPSILLIILTNTIIQLKD